MKNTPNNPKGDIFDTYFGEGGLHKPAPAEVIYFSDGVAMGSIERRGQSTPRQCQNCSDEQLEAVKDAAFCWSIHEDKKEGREKAISLLKEYFRDVREAI